MAKYIVNAEFKIDGLRLTRKNGIPRNLKEAKSFIRKETEYFAFANKIDPEQIIIKKTSAGIQSRDRKTGAVYTLCPVPEHYANTGFPWQTVNVEHL